MRTAQACARTLLDFNGGASCVQIYVNQHDFFISRDRVEAVTASVDHGMWERLTDPDEVAPRSEPALSALYRDIREQISQEAQIIEAVFPQPVVVMQVFLQRVFAQVVQSSAEELLATAQNSSNLAFLRILAATRSSTAQLVQDLKAHDFFQAASARGTEGYQILDVATESSSRADYTRAAAVVTLFTMVDQQMDELYGPHLDHGRYIERESKSLTELYASTLLNFTSLHVSLMSIRPLARL